METLSRITKCVLDSWEKVGLSISSDNLKEDNIQFVDDILFSANAALNTTLLLAPLVGVYTYVQGFRPSRRRRSWNTDTEVMRHLQSEILCFFLFIRVCGPPTAEL
ncbi:hypothetical protein FRX31_028986 [Thalictrum thalictroides]|uniref:Uncharacterized protein n=1 Tax=Thalictrum thalictroides TaxID=46969 RepID=A0A7J6V8P8_THATH|nr:hypothetical protein FRX31_028986 [Thalictrum thalictroides]